MRLFPVRRHLIFLACGAVLTAGGMVEAAIGSPSGTELLVSMHGTAGLHIEGKSQQLSLSEQQGELHFDVPLSSVDTGIGLRNRHMLGYLDATHHPEAELQIARAAIKFPPPGQSVESDAQGTLSLHGVSRPCSVHYRVEQTRPGEYRVHGTTGIDVRDFGVEAPSYLGVHVDPAVTIQLDVSLHDA
ncbi:MAG TPA: YceI family protein [Myxococcaceae bacterium]|nr:YceI family protein [Myxococcaceae bacterium]